MAYDEAADQEKAAKTAKEKTELLVMLDRNFTYSLDHPSWVTGRKVMVECFKYAEGEQWTPSELDVLKERQQPPTVNNQVSVTINSLMGTVTEQQYRIGFRGRNEAPDAMVADGLSDLFLYIRQSNDLEFEETDMAVDGFTCGLGAIEVSVEFDDLYNPEIKLKSKDALVVYPDPDSKRYDWNEDANFISTSEWFPLDDVVARYPKAKAELEGLFSDDASNISGSGSQPALVDSFKQENYVDQNHRKLRIITQEYKKPTRECIYLMDGTGEVILEANWKAEEHKDQVEGVDYEKIERLKKRICKAVYCSSVLLEHKITRNEYFSLIPYWAYRRKNGAPFGPISLALTMQDAINKRESKALHLLNTNQTVAERSAITDVTKYQEEIHKPDGVAIVEDGAVSQEKLVMRNNVELAAAQLELHRKAQEDFYRVTGIDPRIAQNTQEIRSNAGLKRKFSEATKPVARLFANLRRTRKITGRVILERVQNYFTKEKTFLITDNENTAREVNMTAPMVQKIKTAKYDVVVDDFMDTANTEQETFALLLQYLPQLAPLGPFWMKTMIQLSELRADKKKTLLDKLDEHSAPPPADPKISVNVDIAKVSPEEKAFYYVKMGSPETAKAVMEAGRLPEPELQAQTEIQKEMIKKSPEAQDQSKVEAERVKQDTERVKQQGNREKANMDVQIAREKRQLEQQKHQLSMQKGQQDIQKEVIKAAAPKAPAGEKKEKS